VYKQTATLIGISFKKKVCDTKSLQESITRASYSQTKEKQKLKDPAAKSDGCETVEFACG